MNNDTIRYVPMEYQPIINLQPPDPSTCNTCQQRLVTPLGRNGERCYRCWLDMLWTLQVQGDWEAIERHLGVQA